jgi:hypothetical protein
MIACARARTTRHWVLVVVAPWRKGIGCVDLHLRAAVDLD